MSQARELNIEDEDEEARRGGESLLDGIDAGELICHRAARVVGVVTEHPVLSLRGGLRRRFRAGPHREGAGRRLDHESDGEDQARTRELGRDLEDRIRAGRSARWEWRWGRGSSSVAG